MRLVLRSGPKMFQVENIFSIKNYILYNNSNLGSPVFLGAAVFTTDKARGEQIAADRLEAGCCFVNSFVKSDPRLPFGGIKESGYGRELSHFGIREFVNVKSVYIA